MTEGIDPERSRVMALVKGKDTKPELMVRRALWAMGLRYRLHGKTLPGKPDLVFAGRKIVVFVHGCFWHGHQGCPRLRIPRTRRDYWLAKIEGNAARDARNQQALRQMGWRALVIWECEIKTPGRLEALAAEIRRP